MKRAFALVAVAALGISGTSLALEPGLSMGVGGHGIATTSAGGRGVMPLGLGSSGVTGAVTGGRGVSTAIGSGGYNRSTTDGFNTAGVSVKNTGGKGRTTMETVPGRTPTYINIVVGRRDTPLMGAIGP
ncbi:MAG TPA: hypothetical protein VHM90_02240 [Phycisphaerae bacterium]|nr:hypothetical protein [Phycisphaerae bacterium]